MARQTARSTITRDPLPAWLPIAILAATLALLFLGLIRGEVLFWGLPSLQFYPWRQFAMQEFVQGSMALWNPYAGGGAPLLANYQSALLYPPHGLYLLSPTPHMMGWTGILHLLWAGVGMTLFTRRLGLPIFACGISALAYPLCTSIVARFGTFPMVDVAAWLPWLMWGVDRAINRPTITGLIGLTLISGMQLLAGHAQWTFYSLLLAGSYAVWRVWAERHPALRLLVAFVAIAIGALLASGQLLPTAELQRLSQRADRVDEGFALNFSFAPVSLLTLVNPDMFGNPGDGSYAIGGAYFETTAYIGFLPFVLAVIAILRWRRGSAPDDHGRSRLFFIVVTLLSLLLAAGSYLPLYPLLYRYVPTFNLFQAPARWLLLAVFSLSILAAFAAAGWEPTFRGKRAARLLMAMAAALIVTSLIGSAVTSTQPELLQRLVSGLGRIGVTLAITAGLMLIQPKTDARRRTMWQIAALVFIAADLGWANRLSNPTVSAAFYEPCPVEGTASKRTFWLAAEEKQVFDRFLTFTDYTYALQNQQAYRCSRLPNLDMLDKQASLNNFDPLRPAWVEAYATALNQNPTTTLLRAAGVSKVYETAYDDPDAPRVWLAVQVVSATGYQDAIQKISAERTSAAIEGFSRTLSGRPLSAQDQISSVSDRPSSLLIEVTTSADRLLVMADTYYPGWKATINGAETPIYRANGAFRGLYLPDAGKYTVRLWYEPEPFRLGMLISALTAVALVMFGAVAVVVNARRRNVSLS